MFAARYGKTVDMRKAVIAWKRAYPKKALPPEEALALGNAIDEIFLRAQLREKFGKQGTLDKRTKMFRRVSTAASTLLKELTEGGAETNLLLARSKTAVDLRRLRADLEGLRRASTQQNLVKMTWGDTASRELVQSLATALAATGRVVFGPNFRPTVTTREVDTGSRSGSTYERVGPFITFVRVACCLHGVEPPAAETISKAI